jgi:hypothetical protein
VVAAVATGSMTELLDEPKAINAMSASAATAARPTRSFGRGFRPAGPETGLAGGPAGMPGGGTEGMPGGGTEVLTRATSASRFSG